ncbi:alpha/beta fold hydrolase [Clostridium cellulovorans]|uniref:Alpha/beta hydrolase fold n=1 Tax=Clostridium cellulovorans (strain ATCC 35296 / DSM 3052 / OCM 3 / 743B) TaxID=573061 RepID=D9SVR1_CLOC7|nr:alpha/beta hydrolase [Clostridium cellulovorans]ADL53122.1 alpha/beta hydrolase fold [Clostridium cellulovorans 743B]
MDLGFSKVTPTKKIKKWKIISSLLIILLLVWFFHPTWTPAIKNHTNSIAQLKTIEINGAKQEIMIRGVDKSKPAILLVHGGPGCPEISYVRKYQDILEENYVVVNYEQRGMGKSYSFKEDYKGISIDTLVKDLLEVTDYVRSELKADKVILAGHSFGTILGIKAAAKAPEKYHAYIGIGQAGNLWKGELESLEYSLEKAKEKSDTKDIEAIEGYRTLIENKKETLPRTFIVKYGGSYRLIDESSDLIKGILFSKEYNLFDGVKYLKGVSINGDVLWNQVKNMNLPEEVKTLKVPCYFVSGRYDYMTAINTAKEYLDSISAPKKEFVVFEESAHFPQYEEKEKFAKWLEGTCKELKIE